MRIRRFSFLVAVPLIALPVLSGCGGTVIDGQATAAAVLAEVQVKTDTNIESVVCPYDVEVVPGDEFTCDVTATDGSEAKAELRILNDDADVDFIRLTKP